MPTGLFNGTDHANLVTPEPGIAELAENGGRSRSVALLPDSPARDAGLPSFGLTYDQRGPGFPRAFGSEPDIGAFELSLQDLGDRIFSDRFQQAIQH